MNIEKKQDILISKLNTVKKVEQMPEVSEKHRFYSEDKTEVDYFDTVEAALYNYIAPIEKFEAIDNLINLLNVTEDKKLVSLARHLSVLMQNEQAEYRSKVNAMMKVRKAYKSEFDYTDTKSKLRKKQLLTTYKEYMESMKKSKKYDKKFIKRAKKVRVAKDIYDNAFSILGKLNLDYGIMSSLKYGYSSRFEEIDREELVRKFKNIDLVSRYLNTKEYEVEEKKDGLYR